MILIKKRSDFNHLNSIYKDIAELCGIEVSKVLHENYKGLQINFPVKFINKDHILDQLKTEYNGSNYKYLATKYGYSERWIRKLLKDNI